MNIESLSKLSQLSSLTSNYNKNTNSEAFDIALSSLLTAISRVNNYNNSSANITTNMGGCANCCCCGNCGLNTKTQNIQNSLSIDDLSNTINLTQIANKLEASTETENIKLSDKNSTIEIERAIESSAKKYGVDADLIRAIIKTESNFNPNVVSSAGAKGLMQLMPENCKEYGVVDPFDIEENIDAGTRHIKEYIDKYDGDIQMGLMAYNGGPTRMKNRGVNSIDDIYKMPKETQNYVPKVMKYYNEYKNQLV